MRALRSVEGAATCGGGAPVKVAAAEVHREAIPDPTGRFVLRRLPAGHLTLVVSCPDMQFEQGIDVPPEPGTLRGVRLSPPKGSGSAAG